MTISNEPINAEPSMDEILSSIRRILKDDEPMMVPPEANAAGAAAPAEPIMVLDTSMMVSQPNPAARHLHDVPPPEPINSQPTLSSATPDEVEATDMPYEPAPAVPASDDHPNADATSTFEGPQPILGTRAAEAASSHIGALVRTITADRNLSVSRGGISIEEIVREEIRPMLKSWLDAHLPGLVERVVRTEIERLVGRDGL